MRLPIPHLKRIIPFTVSQWNTIKGWSDTITKLLWINMYDPPSNSPSSHAIARMFLLGMVIVHCLHQMFTSNSDLTTYTSLKHFWNASEANFMTHCCKLCMELSNNISFHFKPYSHQFLHYQRMVFSWGELTREWKLLHGVQCHP
jgi:hypothetical protein